MIRPKSIATVVVRLSGTRAGSSTPTEAEVISCSVSSGGISDSEPTSVVLPTPNPPAISTLSGMRSVESACTKTLQEPLEDFGGGLPSAVVGTGGRWTTRYLAFTRSLTSTRATPTGTPREAPISTIDTGVAASSTVMRYSSCRSVARTPASVVVTSASTGMSGPSFARVRPPVTAYTGTTRPP